MTQSRDGGLAYGQSMLVQPSRGWFIFFVSLALVSCEMVSLVVDQLSQSLCTVENSCSLRGILGVRVGVCWQWKDIIEVINLTGAHFKSRAWFWDSGLCGRVLGRRDIIGRGCQTAERLGPRHLGSRCGMQALTVQLSVCGIRWQVGLGKRQLQGFRRGVPS